MNQNEEHLRLLSIFHYIVAGLAALFSFFPLVYAGMCAFFIFASHHVTPKPGQDFQFVRPAELHSAEYGYTGQNVRWAHRQYAYVPLQ